MNMKKFTKLCVAACALLAGTAAFADDHVWKFVTTGDATTYAIRNDGTLWAWGWNEKGQTGNSISERSAVPTLTDASRAWKKVVGGKAYGFFLAEDGSLWAAGTQEQGVQGVGDGMDHKVLTRIGTEVLQVGGETVSVGEATFFDFMHHYDVTLMNPTVLSGMFIGSMMTFLFCGLTMNAVGRAAARMVAEVRRQFREIKGILTGETEPDYERCVAISTKGAQREMVVPSLLAIIAPVLTGLVFGVPGVLGLLIGGLSTGFVLAIFMANAGGAWDNAKKYVEEGNFGGKGSEVHKATVVGDTVGDPFKDTSGPSLNILIKLMSMVAIVMAGLTVAWSLF